jgi:hypothetical protein
VAKPILLSVNIPFSGFYGSLWSDLIDHDYESWVEGASERENEDTPEPLRLDDSELADCLFWAMDYSAAYQEIAKDYSAAYNDWASEEIGFPLRMTFEEMTSPREYNFATDRIFCHIPLSVVRRLFAISRKEGHSRLADMIKRRFTSYSGFISGYSNTLHDWLSKPLQDWDHNELGTLLLAVVGEPDDDLTIYYRLADNSWQYFETAVDWKRFETRVQEARDVKAAEWKAENPDSDIPEPPYRCHLTPDLFAWAPQ